jgi:hypothetical protein
LLLEGFHFLEASFESVPSSGRNRKPLGEVISFAGEKESAVARSDQLALEESGDTVELCLFDSSVHDLQGLLVARCVTKKS